MFSLEVWHRLGLVTAWFISYRPHNDCWSVLVAANQLFHDFSVMFQGFFTEVITDKTKTKKKSRLIWTSNCLYVLKEYSMEIIQPVCHRRILRSFIHQKKIRNFTKLLHCYNRLTRLVNSYVICFIREEFVKNIEDIGTLSIRSLEKNKVMTLKNGRNHFKSYCPSG